MYLISWSRFRKEIIGGGVGKGLVGRPPEGPSNIGGTGAVESRGDVVTPLSERKPIKHHCKYCSQPFIR